MLEHEGCPAPAWTFVVGIGWVNLRSIPGRECTRMAVIALQGSADLLEIVEMATITPMMAITTNSSTSEKPARVRAMTGPALVERMLERRRAEMKRAVAPID